MTRLFVSAGAASAAQDLGRGCAALAPLGQGAWRTGLAPDFAAAVAAAGPADGAVHRTEDLVVLVAGQVLWADPALAAEWPPAAGPDRGARLLADAWRRHGDQFLSHVDGNFAVVLCDLRRHQVVLGTDRFAGVPIQWAMQDGHLLAASHLAGFDGSFAADAVPDHRALSDLMAFGYLVGDKTLLSGVRRVPPGSTVTFTQGRTVITPYFVPQWQPDPSCRNVRVLGDELAALLQRVLARHARGVELPGALLSGGHDSRVLVAAAHAQGLRLRTWTFGDPDSRDAVLARAIASALSLPHEVIGITAADVVAHAGHALALTDGAFNLFHTHGISVLPHIAQQCGALFNGITALHGAHVARQVRRFGAECPSEPHPGFLIDDLMAVRLPDQTWFGSVFGGDEALLRPEVRARFAAATAKSAAEFAALPPVSDCVWDRAERAYLHGRLVRFTGNGPILSRAFLPVRTPLLDQEFLAFCRKLPPALRGADKEIVAHAIRRLAPAAADVPLSGTGRPAGLPRWRDTLHRVGSRVRRALVRLGLGAPQHTRPYADYEHWLRERGPLRVLVSDTLGAPDAELTEWIEPATLRRLVEAQHLGWNGSEFLGRLLTLELALRARRQARSAPAAQEPLRPALPRGS